jgi:hypothetical protein
MVALMEYKMVDQSAVLLALDWVGLLVSLTADLMVDQSALLVEYM